MMIGTDWAEQPEALDAFWEDAPPTDSDGHLAMDVDTRELWHAFAYAAEQHELRVLCARSKGRLPRRIVVGSR